MPKRNFGKLWDPLDKKSMEISIQIRAQESHLEVAADVNVTSFMLHPFQYVTTIRGCMFH